MRVRPRPPQPELIPPPAGIPASTSAPTDASATVLVVDDDPAVRATLTRVLRVLGFAVLAADGPPTALALADGHADPICLLVTDLDTPDGTGADLARAFGATRPGTPVLFVSGRPAPRNLSDAVVGRPAAFLAKPFTLDGLRAAVVELLGPPGSGVRRRAAQ